MKKLLSILLLFVSFGAFAQTYDTLPAGSKPYGNQLYLSPSGLIIGGTGSAKFRVIGTKKYVDSLLALKVNVSQLALYQTKANLQQNLNASSDAYPSVNAVNAGLNVKSDLTYVNQQLATKAPESGSNNYIQNIQNAEGTIQNAGINISGGLSATNVIAKGNLAVNENFTASKKVNLLTPPDDSFANFDFVTRDKTTGELKKIDQAVIPDLAPYQVRSEKGQANGYAGLDGAGKVPLTQINDALLGAVNYRGTYNAATNSPAMPTPASSNKGYYYIISTAGTQFGLEFRVGDWIISNGSAYGKVASSSDVESVAGKKGVVLLDKNDVGLSNVDNTNDLNKPVSSPTQAALIAKANLVGGNIFSGDQKINNSYLSITANSNQFLNLGVFGNQVSGVNYLQGGIEFYKSLQTNQVVRTSASLVANANQTSNAISLSLPENAGTLATLSDITSAGTGYLKPADVATGQTIGANTTGTASSATQWSRNTSNFSYGEADYLLGSKNNVANALSSETVRNFVGVGNGSLLNNVSASSNYWNTNKVTNFNSETGFALLQASGGTIPNQPIGGSWGQGIQFSVDNNPDYVNQLVFDLNGGLHKRSKVIGSWYPWERIATTNDLANETLQTITNRGNSTTSGIFINRPSFSPYKFIVNSGVNVNIGLGNQAGVATIESFNDAISARTPLLVTASNITLDANTDVSGSARASSNDGNANTLVRNTDIPGLLSNKADRTGTNTFSGTNNFSDNVNMTGQFSVLTIRGGLNLGYNSAFYASLSTQTSGISGKSLGQIQLNIANTNGTSGTSYVGNLKRPDVAANFDWTLPAYSGVIVGNIERNEPLDFPNVMMNQNATLTLTVTGAEINDVITLGLPNSILTTMSGWNGTFQAWVSATNTVSVRFQNNDPLAAHDLPSGQFKIRVLK